MVTRSTVVGLLAVLLPAVASAQAPSLSTSTRPSVIVFANGGGNSPLTNLNETGTADLKTGWTVGGGAGVQVNQYLAVRGVFDFARDKGSAGSTAFAGQRFNHYFYGGDVQLRYPTTSGFAPYLLAGAGAVTIDNKDDPTSNKTTKFAGKGGVGVEYVFPNNGFGLFAQGASYVYKFDRNGFNKTQFDVLWTAGLSYRFPL
jgi:opacity protein-like surface antigen